MNQTLKDIYERKSVRVFEDRASEVYRHSTDGSGIL